MRTAPALVVVAADTGMSGCQMWARRPAPALTGKVAFWDLTDPHHPTMIGQPLTAARDIIYATAFTSDGRIFATGSADGIVRLWDLTDRGHPTPIGPEITGLDGHIQTVAFSPDGHILAAANGDFRLWDMDPERVATQIFSTAGDIISETEWKAPTRRRLPTRLPLSRGMATGA